MYESRKRSIAQEFSSRGHQYCLYRGSMDKCDSGTRVNNNSNRVKETWMSSSSRLECSLSWPPRSYSCSFCKKELRSAQALGGHMNVHRKDKARLREFPPHPGPPVWNYTNPNLNSTIGSYSNIPNPNMPPPSTSVADCDVIPVTYTSPATEPPPFVPLCSSSTASKGLARTARRVELEEEGISRDEDDLCKNKRVINLDLQMGLFGTNHGDGPDLELRLGCS